MKRATFLMATIAITVAGGLGGAYAARDDRNDALDIAHAKIGLAAAVATAEQSIGGRAARAEIERHGKRWVFDVEVVKDRLATDIQVDAESGKVLGATTDGVDRDDDHDAID